MKRIDFLGAPGVGKSTLYEKLMNDNSKYLSSDEAKNKIAKGLLRKDNINFQNLIIKLILLFPVYKKLNEFLVNNYLKSYFYKYLLSNHEQYIDFLNISLKDIDKEEKSPFRRLLGIEWFFNKFKEVVFLESTTYKDIVIYDESLSQKIFGLVSKNTDYKKKTIEYFENIPMPCGLIYFKLNLDDNYNRIKNRDKVIPGHRGLNENELKKSLNVAQNITSCGSEVLKTRGLDICVINMKDDIDINIRKIKDYINNI